MHLHRKPGLLAAGLLLASLPVAGCGPMIFADADALAVVGTPPPPPEAGEEPRTNAGGGGRSRRLPSPRPRQRSTPRGVVLDAPRSSR